MRLAALLAVFTSACGGSAPPPAAPRLPARVVDLTHTLDEKTTIAWPTSPSSFHRDTLSFGRTPGGFFYTAGSFAAVEHAGTHLDAPIHFSEGGATVEAIPVERFAGPAVVIDIRERAERDADTLVTPRDLDDFEREHGKIEPGTIVLLRTGWASRWPDRKRYLGDDTPGDASRLHFPGLGADAARALVDRDIAAVGIDTASIDHGPSRDFAAHQVLAGAGVPVFENVASLAAIPPRGALVVALPMKIGAGSGAPLRIVAYLP
jgi:kynurenine formamidase